MEHVDGGDLYAYLDRRGRIPEPEAIGYFRHILSAIEFMHSFHICHRDLKLENILMDGHGRIFVADLGLAIRSNGVRLDDHCGSLHYCPPEVSDADDAYDGIKADIWALACLISALVAGWLPFDHPSLSTDDEVRAAIAELGFRIPKEFSEELKHFVYSIFKFRPEDRPTLEDLWKHPAITRFPNKDKNGVESDRYQMPFTHVDLLGSVVQEPHLLNQDSLDSLSIIWQRNIAQIKFYLMCDRYVQKSIFIMAITNNLIGLTS